VLIACEFSGIVRDAFAAKGHDAWSCDLLPTERPGQHIQEDVQYIYDLGIWDLMIAFPPCTHLASSGAKHFHRKADLQKSALFFIQQIMDAPIEYIALENPVGIISTRIRKPDQIIQPWQFGDSYQKTTCLWLKNLPELIPTQIVGKGEFVIHGGKKFPKWYSNRTRKRDKTFPGIAEAMADQWGRYMTACQPKESHE